MGQKDPSIPPSFLKMFLQRIFQQYPNSCATEALKLTSPITFPVPPSLKGTERGSLASEKLSGRLVRKGLIQSPQESFKLKNGNFFHLLQQKLDQVNREQLTHQSLAGTEMDAVSIKEHNSFDNRQHRLEVLGNPPHVWYAAEG